MQKIQTILVDDLTGEEVTDAGRTVTFAIEGVEYEIDLNEENLAKFHEAMQVYTDHARRVGGRRRTGGSAAKTDSAQLDAMRKWGRENGYKVSDRGRVSQEVQDAYHAAH